MLHGCHKGNTNVKYFVGDLEIVFVGISFRPLLELHIAPPVSSSIHWMHFSFGTTMRLPTRSTGESSWCISSYPLDGDVPGTFASLWFLQTDTFICVWHRFDIMFGWCPSCLSTCIGEITSYWHTFDRKTERLLCSRRSVLGWIIYLCAGFRSRHVPSASSRSFSRRARAKKNFFCW